jgi:simple sugar transport system ATP-binding protein
VTRPALELASSLGWEFDPNAKVRSLAVGGQQRLEIIKALSSNAQVIIFDEPTAVLSPVEVDELFRVLAELKSRGKTLVLIAHKLSEVMKIADKVTVLRRGKVVASSAIDQTSPEQLAIWMVGETPVLSPKPLVLDQSPGIRADNLRIFGDRGNLAIASISFSVNRGEILGIGGVDGNGQVELAECLAGIRPYEGKLDWVKNGKAPRIAYIPQNRHLDGLALSLSVRDNLLINGYQRPDLRRGPFFFIRAITNWCRRLIERFEIKTDSAAIQVSSLSGGNQQKVVLARTLDTVPDLLIAVNPTRGLDVKATRFVHDQILDAKNAGAAVVLISTDLDELAELATQTLYLSRGKLMEGDAALGLAGGAT